MFIGEYNHSVDPKGRLIIPSKFRDVLGDLFMVTKGLDGCLFVFDKNEWDAFVEKLRTLPISNIEARKIVRYFLAGAAELEVDKQGRVLLPGTLREFAGIEKETVLVGVGNRMEIWSKDKWDGTNTYDDVEELAEHLAEFGFNI